MKVLLDECLPRKLKNAFTSHVCQTVPKAGLAGQKNGRLLALAEQSGYQLFVSIDKGLPYQQNLAGRNIAILIIRCKSNRLADLLPHVPECLSIMTLVQPGQVVRTAG